MRRLYHVPQGSIYIELYRLRYKGNGYSRYWIKYYSKSSDVLITDERNVKISDKVKSWWRVYEH
jgi:hypothetical protein